MAAALVCVAAATTSVGTVREVSAAPGDHVVTTIAGTLGEGPALSVQNGINEVATSGSTLYATDHTYSVIRAVDLTNGHERTVAGAGSRYGFYGDGGRATAAGLSSPRGIAVDASGNLFVADNWNRRVRKVTPAGVITTFAGGGPPGARGDGVAATAVEVAPDSLAVNAEGELYMTDGGLIRKVDAAGIITTVAGGDGDLLFDGQPAKGRYIVGTPDGLTFDAEGNLYFIELSMQRIWKLDRNGLAWGVRHQASDHSDQTNRPRDLVMRPDGTLLVLTGTQVLAVDAAGNTTAVVGNGTAGYGGDGGPATAASSQVRTTWTSTPPATSTSPAAASAGSTPPGPSPPSPA